VQTLALAEGAAERAAADLAALPSWDVALTGAATAGFFDGAGGVRHTGAAVIDIDLESARLMCGAASCAGHPPEAVTGARPWGHNNPHWTVYASGTAAELLGSGAIRVAGYAVVWVADDPAENDADPLRDGGPPAPEASGAGNPGLDAIMLRATAWGPRGSRREVQWVVERADPIAHTGLRRRVWREIRGAEPG
jgi:hypothetical protein